MNVIGKIRHFWSIIPRSSIPHSTLARGRGAQLISSIRRSFYPSVLCPGCNYGNSYPPVFAGLWDSELTCLSTVQNALPGPVVMQQRFYKRKLTVKRPPTKVLNFEWGGDLSKAYYPVDETKPRVEFEGAEEFEHSQETVKRILSLEFGTEADRRKRRLYDLLECIKEHPLQIRTLEVKVAYLTVVIRTQTAHVENYRQDKRSKVSLIDRLHRRRRLLKELRLLDFEKYTWLCEELDIKFIPEPEYNRKLSKRALKKREARLAAFAIMNNKLAQYKQTVEEEKKAFAVHKEQELAAIEREIAELGLDDDSQIAKVCKALKEGTLETKEGRQITTKSRRKLILEKKFELGERIKLERQAAKQA